MCQRPHACPPHFIAINWFLNGPEREGIGWKKTYLIHVANKEFISEICKELLEFIRKRQCNRQVDKKIQADHREVIQMGKKNFYRNHIYTLFQKIEKGTMLPDSFYESSMTSIPKSDKDSTKKKKRLISLMILDTKILNKMWINLIQQCIKIITHHNQVGFTPDIQGWFENNLSLWKSINVITLLTD